MPAFNVKGGGSRGIPALVKAPQVPSHIKIGRPTPGNERAKGMPTNIRVRKVDANAMGMALPRPQPRDVAGLGNPQAMQQQQSNQPAIGTLGCIKCGTSVTPRVDAMTTRDGEGPMCKNCWAHIWVSHGLRGITSERAGDTAVPSCTMGVRFDKAEMRVIQEAIHGLTVDIGRARGRFPTPDEMNAVLGEMKFSQVCKTCGTDVKYALDSRDFAIAGVTAPWPQNKPLPWLSNGR